MNIPVRRLTETAIIPSKVRPSDACFDLYVDRMQEIEGNRHVAWTGIAFAIPEGYAGFIEPCSGLAIKHGIQVLGGVLDAGFRGEVGVIFLVTGLQDAEINAGDRIAQLAIRKVEEVEFVEQEELGTTERGAKGFGSSGA